MGVYWEIFVFCRIQLKCCSRLYKQRWHPSWKFQFEKTSNKKVISKKPLTNLYEMNSRWRHPCHWIMQYETPGRSLTVLNISKLKNWLQPNRKRTEPFWKICLILKKVAHSFEPGETPSNSVPPQAQKYVQRSEIPQDMIKWWQKEYRKRNWTAPEPEIMSN